MIKEDQRNTLEFSEKALRAAELMLWRRYISSMNGPSTPLSSARSTLPAQTIFLLLLQALRIYCPSKIFCHQIILGQVLIIYLTVLGFVHDIHQDATIALYRLGLHDVGQREPQGKMKERKELREQLKPKMTRMEPFTTYVFRISNIFTNFTSYAALFPIGLKYHHHQIGQEKPDGGTRDLRIQGPYLYAYYWQ